MHNQRIERLWYDVHRCVTTLFYHLFYFKEHWNLLIQSIASVYSMCIGLESKLWVFFVRDGITMKSELLVTFTTPVICARCSLFALVRADSYGCIGLSR